MNGLTPLEPNYYEFVEVDSTGRYGRYNEILGKGASKTVYRAFDEFEGIEVAWNQVKLYDFLQSPEDLGRLYSEIHLLKTLKHKNIMKFYSSWVDIANRNINFVTEMFTSGTLRQYRQKHKRVNIRVVKHWCRQILKGLLYLHSHDPPVIHRDLKCDNIFINGNQGEVKIGDLGLAAILRKSHAAHCVGTPEFMAPEVYKEEYNELVDIYSFGMCVLEMVTFDYPYSECSHPAQIYKKVISGEKPDALYKVKDPEVRQFIEKCLVTVSQRLPASELLKDPFLQIDNCGANLRPIEYSGKIDGMGPLLMQPFIELHHGSNGSLFNGYSSDLDIELENEWGFHPIEIEPNGTELFTCNEDEHSPNVDITIKGRRKEDDSIFLRIRIADKEGRVRNIYFPFDIENDTALSVATEMVAELDITDQDVISIADMIDGEIASLVPKWKPGPGIEESPRFANASLCHNCASNSSSIGSLIDLFSLNNPSNKNMQILHCSQHGCAATRGRFEEITYNVDGVEHCVTKGAPMVSSQSDGNQYVPKLSSEGSSKSHFDGLEQLDYSTSESIIDKSVIVVANHIKPNARNSTYPKIHSSVHVISDDYGNEVRQEFRWLKAKYQMELMEMKELKIQQLEANSKAPIWSPDFDTREHMTCLPMSTSVQGESNENLIKSVSSGKCGSSYLAHVHNISPNSEIRKDQHCKATIESCSPEHLFTSKSFYGGALLPHSLHRTTSLPVDAFDV